MLLAEIDPIQIGIIVIAMAAGFIQWLWKTIKQSLEESKRPDTPLDPEEKRRRDEAWRRQVQQGQDAAQQQQPQRPYRPSPTATPPINPWGNVRDVFEKMKEEMRKAQGEASQPPSRPPALPQRPASSPQLPPPQRPIPGTVRADMQPPQPQPYFQTPVQRPTSMPVHTTPQAAPAPVLPAQRAAVVARPNITPRQTAAKPLIRLPRPDSHGLRALLMTPDSLRQAILLKEVLGPPKSLQSTGDSPL